LAFIAFVYYFYCSLLFLKAEVGEKVRGTGEATIIEWKNNRKKPAKG